MLINKPGVKKEASLFFDFAFCLFIYFLIILFFGYAIGVGDSAEFIGYSVNRNNPFVIQNDLFIGSMESMILNERWAYLSVVSLFSGYEEYFSIVFHALLSIILFLGLIKVSALFIVNRLWIYLILLFSLLIFYTKGTGGNELYHIDLQSTTFSTAAGIWAIYFFLRKKKYQGIVLSFISLIFQPIEGFHLIFISGIAYIISSYRTSDFKPALIAFSLAFVIGGLYVIILLAQQKNGIESGLNSEEYFKTVFLFRFPHHFIPNYFSWIGILINSFLLISGLAVFKYKNKFIFYFLVIIGVGVIVYTLDLYSGSHLLTKSWWFRSTIWIRFIGLIALALLFPMLSKTIPFLKYIFLVTVLGFFSVFFVVKASKFQNNHYHFGSQVKYNPEINICSKVNKILPKEALIVHPFDFTALNYYGRRASYVNFKTIPRSKQAINIWRKRLKEVYNIPTNRPFSIETQEAAEKNFYKINLEALKVEGVTHVITYIDFPEKGLDIVASNEFYKVIKL